MITGNLGEWSELYAFLKLISDGKVHLGDAEKNIIVGAYHTIEKIIRHPDDNSFSYTPAGNKILIQNDDTSLEVDMMKFKDAAESLLASMKNHSSGPYSNVEIETFMQEICCSKLKANSQSKTDITLFIHDEQINKSSELGFSIKSELGSKSTLFNASGRTKFRYSVTDIDFKKHASTINAKRQISDVIKTINELGGSVAYCCVADQNFLANLTLIDGNLPKIIGCLLFDSYIAENKNINDLIPIITNSNPCNFPQEHGHPFYDSKIKRFLVDVALGMTASAVWTATYQANGGYLLVKKSGEILCYHIYDKAKFENYLVSNTKFDSPSRSRHNYGHIFQEDSDIFLELSLQIRFR